MLIGAWARSLHRASNGQPIYGALLRCCEVVVETRHRGYNKQAGSRFLQLEAKQSTTCKYVPIATKPIALFERRHCGYGVAAKRFCGERCCAHPLRQACPSNGQGSVCGLQMRWRLLNRRPMSAFATLLFGLILSRSSAFTPSLQQHLPTIPFHLSLFIEHTTVTASDTNDSFDDRKHALLNPCTRAIRGCCVRPRSIHD